MKGGMSIFMQNTNNKWSDYEVYQNDLKLADLAQPLGVDSICRATASPHTGEAHLERLPTRFLPSRGIHGRTVCYDAWRNPLYPYERA